MMRNRLREFAEQLRNAPTDEKSERIVRIMVGEVGNNCPMDLLVQLGQRIVDYRKLELRDETERN